MPGPPKMKLPKKTKGANVAKPKKQAPKFTENIKRKDSTKKRKVRSIGPKPSASRLSQTSRVLYSENYQIRKSLYHFIVQKLEAQNIELYYQRVFILAENQESEDSATSTIKTRANAYLRSFRHHFNNITANVDLNKISNDPISGLLICMGNYTLFMIEGPDQTLGEFFAQLTPIQSKLWKKSKIFLVENQINFQYFNTFLTYTSDAINTNEKFPPNTTTEPHLMAVQHVALKDKILEVVKTISEKAEDSEWRDGKNLPADPFNKLLPQIQCIDLCLDADKFYLNLDHFTEMYFSLTFTKQFDTWFWPIENNYAPLNVLNRSAFDVNLTFSDYGKTDGVDDEKSEMLVQFSEETLNTETTDGADGGDA